MQQTNVKHFVELPSTLVGRCGLAIVCILIFPISLCICYALTFMAPLPRSLNGWVIRCIVELFSFGMLWFSFFGFIWAVTRTAWSERLLQSGMLKILIALIVFCFFSLPFVFWAMLNGA